MRKKQKKDVLTIDVIIYLETKNKTKQKFRGVRIIELHEGDYLEIITFQQLSYILLSQLQNINKKKNSSHENNEKIINSQEKS